MAYLYWVTLHKNFPKVERLSLGQKIEHSFLDVLEVTYLSTYLQPDQKVIGLGKAISKLDVAKFFMQIAWENKLIPLDKYADISGKLGEVGRMLGGWRKGVIEKLNKTPPPRK